MRSMFEMGFQNDIFGGRVGSPMLGQVRLRGYGSALGQAAPDGNALLAQLNQAENQVAAASAYIQNHPNLQADLGGDFAAFQQAMSQITADSDVETRAKGQLAATGPTDQFQIGSNDLATLQDYITNAGTLANIIAAHPNVSASVATPGAPAGTVPLAPTNPAGYLIPAQKSGTAPAAKVAAPASSPLTAPLLVGGGVLAIGLIALLARPA